jgi:hypothetical protein
MTEPIDPIDLALQNVQMKLRQAERKTDPQNFEAQSVLMREAAKHLAEAVRLVHERVRELDLRVDQID